MGKQIRYYMLPEDEEVFVSFVRTTGDIRLLPYAFDHEQIPSLASLPIPGSRKFATSLCFFNATISQNLKTSYIEKQLHYAVDELNSSVVEFSRCLRKGSRLDLGRLYIETYRLEDGHMVRKEPEFIRWYDRLARWIRKNYERHEDEWIGPEAAKWWRAGGELVQFHKE